MAASNSWVELDVLSEEGLPHFSNFADCLYVDVEVNLWRPEVFAYYIRLLRGEFSLLRLLEFVPLQLDTAIPSTRALGCPKRA